MNNVDSIRLEQFRQMKKEIRGSKEYLIAGPHNPFIKNP